MLKGHLSFKWMFLLIKLPLNFLPQENKFMKVSASLTKCVFQRHNNPQGLP